MVKLTGLGIAAVLAAALTGCAGTEPGQPNPVTTSGGPGGVDQVPANDNSTIAFPTRPKDFSLMGADPCALISAAQRVPLGIDAGTSDGVDHVFKAPDCVFPLSSDPTTEYGITAVSTQGIDHWLNPNLADNLKQVTVGGYPALDVTSKISGDNQCSTVVSVANGQMLIADWGLPPDAVTTAVACTRTEAVAAAALTTLRTRK